jgi:hypothetical protein
VGSQEDNWSYHVVGFGSVEAGVRPTIAWQPSRAEPPDHWRAVATVEPVPLPCPELRGISIRVAQYAQRSVDITPKTGGREVCDSLGFVNRGECPFAAEREDGTIDPQRARCEAFYGPYRCTVGGEECGRFNDNPLMWGAAAPGRYVICSRTGVCGSVDLP